MFTEIDKVLYPNKCEVIQTASHEFLYPIFKNGSSSLLETAKDNNWKIILNEQIFNCKNIVVFLRNPSERINSGINTFVNHLLEQDLDEKTITYFVNNYLFLNRHYMPQILWLIHLARYANPNCILNIKDINDIKIYSNKIENKSEKLKNYNHEHIEKINFYLEADYYLLKYINKSLSVNDLFVSYKKDCPNGFNHIFNYSENLINALPKN